MANAARSKLEYMFAAYVLNTLGVACVAFAVGFGSTAEIDVGPWQRTIPGLAVALVMGLVGEVLARRSKEGTWWANSWFSTNLLAFAYSLAYFFIYAMYYVPILQGLHNPYAVWALGLMLGGVGALHGVSNKNVRWFTSPFTLVATGHALFQALTNTGIVQLGGHDIKVAALGCFIGMIWCGALSVAFKRVELKYPEWANCKTFDEAAGWLNYRISHELFFVLAGLCAMALPLIVGTIHDAPLWWSWEAPVLLAISWRNGNLIKHAAVAVMWSAAWWTFANTPFEQALPLATTLSVVGVGAAIAMAYRFESILPAQFRLPTTVPHSHKFIGYAFYLYGAIACSLLVPYKQFGLWDAMPYLMVAALVICGVGIALRDGLAHNIGVAAAAVALVLFFGHFNSWTWPLVGPIVALCYALSLSYTYVHKQGGWKRSDFLPFGSEYAVSEKWAEGLEKLWSWVGFATLIGASYVLVDHEHAVLYWAAEALVLIVFGFGTDRFGYRLQGLIALGLPLAKLVLWDMSGSQISWNLATGVITWNPVKALIWYRAGEFGVEGLCLIIASFFYFRKVAQMKAADAAAATAAAKTTGEEHDGKA